MITERVIRCYFCGADVHCHATERKKLIPTRGHEALGYPEWETDSETHNINFEYSFGQEVPDIYITHCANNAAHAKRLLHWEKESPVTGPFTDKADEQQFRLHLEDSEEKRRFRDVVEKSKRQKRELRSLNKALLLKHTMLVNLIHEKHRDREYFNLQVKQMDKRDYRGVCRCWSCTFRQWWQYRSGKIYPASKHPRFSGEWRFPWVKRT